MEGYNLTSFVPYIEKVIPTLSNRHREVIGIFKEPKHDWTNAELSDRLGWSINRITPRVFELRQKRLVIFSQIRTCSVTRESVNAWKLNEQYKTERIRQSVLDRLNLERIQPKLLN